jgi:hypothetical protein
MQGPALSLTAAKLLHQQWSKTKTTESTALQTSLAIFQRTHSQTNSGVPPIPPRPKSKKSGVFAHLAKLSLPACPFFRRAHSRTDRTRPRHALKKLLCFLSPPWRVPTDLTYLKYTSRRSPQNRYSHSTTTLSFTRGSIHANTHLRLSHILDFTSTKP